MKYNCFQRLAVGWLLLVASVLCFGQAPKSVSFNPAIVTSGNTSTGTVVLTAAAPTGGVSVALTSQVSSVVVPASVTVSAGASSATFSIHTSAVAKSFSCSIKASDSAGASSATLSVEAQGLSSITVSPSSVLAGATSSGTLTLLGPAPAGGWSVTLSSASPSVSVPAKVIVPAGKSSATFLVTTFTGYISQNTDVAIAAKDATSSASRTIKLLYESLSLSLNETTIYGGGSALATVTLAYAAPTAGMTVYLTNDNPDVAQVPIYVIVPSGATQATFPINTPNLIQNGTFADIEANDGVAIANVTLNIDPSPIFGMSMRPSTIAGGQQTDCVITLKSPAPTGGLKFALKSSTASAVLPGSTVIPAGASVGAFPIASKEVTKTSVALITASVGSIAVSANLTIRPSLVRWSFSISDYANKAAIGPVGQVYFSTYGYLYSFNSQGLQTWNVGAGDHQEFGSPAVDANGDVFVTGADGTLNAYGSQGQVLWTYQTKEYGLSDPTVFGSTVYMNSASGLLYAVSTSGTFKWKFLSGSYYGSPPTVGPDGTIYSPSANYLHNAVYALSSNGSVKWTFQMDQSSQSAPALAADGSVLVRGDDGTLFDLSPTGKLKWVYLVDAVDYVNSAVSVGPDGTIYCNNDYSIIALSSTGQLKWEYYGVLLPGGISVSKTGNLYFTDYSGIVYSMNDSGVLLWEYQTNAFEIDYAPTVAPDGTVYVGADYDSLYAFYP